MCARARVHVCVRACVWREGRLLAAPRPRPQTLQPKGAMIDDTIDTTEATH